MFFSSKFSCFLAKRRIYRIQLYTVTTLHGHNWTPKNSTRPQLNAPQLDKAQLDTATTGYGTTLQVKTRHGITRHATTLHRPRGRRIEATIE